MPDWSIAIFSSLGGGLVAGGVVAWIAQTLSDKAEQLRIRREVLRKLAGHRYALTPKFKGSDGEIWVALNEIAVAFAEHEKVMAALDQFQNDVKQGFKAEHLSQLIREMTNAAKLPVASLDATRIENPFTPPKR